MEAWVVATALIGLYLLATLGLGFFAHRRVSLDLEDFLLYGRKAGVVVLYLSVVATYHSAFAFLGSSGFFYTHGIGFWDAGTWTILVGAITYVLGTRIWFLGKRFGYMTPADLVADFYESEALRVLVAFVSVVFTILYIQVQAQGLGYILSVASDDRISFELGTFTLLVVAGIYLMAGGLRAVYWTDVVQGVWMYLAIWIGAIVVAKSVFGSPFDVFREVASVRPELLTLPGPNGFFTPGMWIGLMVSLCGVMFMPQMMIRYYTAVSARTIRFLGATTPIYLASLYVPAALVGLTGAVALPGLEIADRVFPELLMRHAPAWLTGLILAGAVAAAMSTLDSILHANMTVLTRDVYQRFMVPNASQEHYLWIGRAIVIVLLAIGFVLSISSFEFLVVLVSLSGSGALQLAPSVCGVCFPGKYIVTPAGAISGLSVGLAVLFLTLVAYPHPLGVHGSVWALSMNTLVTFVVSRITRRSSDSTIQRIHGALEEFVYE